MIEYVILENKTSFSEIQSRIRYCSNVFHMYFTYQHKNDYIIIKSFPNVNSKYTFIIGHNYKIVQYLLARKQPIKNIIIISCQIPDSYISKWKAKRIFLSKQNKEKKYYYDGKDWGFDFNITEEELELYNTPEKNILKKIKGIFRRVK